MKIELYLNFENGEREREREKKRENERDREKWSYLHFHSEIPIRYKRILAQFLYNFNNQEMVKDNKLLLPIRDGQYIEGRGEMKGEIRRDRVKVERTLDTSKVQSIFKI